MRGGFGDAVVGFGGAWAEGFVGVVFFVVGKAEKLGDLGLLRLWGGGFRREDGGSGREVFVVVGVGTAAEIAGFGGGHGVGKARRKFEVRKGKSNIRVKKHMNSKKYI